MEKNRGKDELGREDENDKNKMEVTDELRDEEEFKKFDLRKKEISSKDKDPDWSKSIMLKTFSHSSSFEVMIPSIGGGD